MNKPTITPVDTPNGKRYDLAVYVYPDGHGNITGGAKSGVNIPVNDLTEALLAFGALWTKAAES